LPCSVVGPRDFAPLRRLASARALDTRWVVIMLISWLGVCRSRALRTGLVSPGTPSLYDHRNKFKPAATSLEPSLAWVPR
jgi:hypothetical protein